MPFIHTLAYLIECSAAHVFMRAEKVIVHYQKIKIACIC